MEIGQIEPLTFLIQCFLKQYWHCTLQVVVNSIFIVFELYVNSSLVSIVPVPLNSCDTFDFCKLHACDCGVMKACAWGPNNY